MPIFDIRFIHKSLSQLPHPPAGCQEYRDTLCPHLRALVYPKRITLALRCTIKNKRIYETLGTFPLLSVDAARQPGHSGIQNNEIDAEYTRKGTLRNVRHKLLSRRTK